jgi:hypothetical protein
LLAAALAHTPEAEEALRGARTRMARKPPALARELLRNFPKRRARNSRRRRNKGGGGAKNGAGGAQAAGRNGAKRGQAQAPSEAVLDEALASESPDHTHNGTGLEPAAEGKLDRNVAEALEHAEE